MSAIDSIGSSPWTKEDFLERLEEFAILNRDRPIENNKYGMRSPHTFLAWFVARWMRPGHIIESGVAFGQGSWFFEKACPDTKLYCIEPYIELPKIYYKPANMRQCPECCGLRFEGEVCPACGEVGLPIEKGR